MKYKVKFGKERKAPAAAPKVSRLATQLALAHHIERLVEGGHVRSYAAAARMLGISRGRLGQILGLVNLSPDIQARILTGDLVGSERRVRQVVGVAEWREQAETLAR
jgi:hypothetical protein